MRQQIFRTGFLLVTTAMAVPTIILICYAYRVLQDSLLIFFVLLTVWIGLLLLGNYLAQKIVHPIGELNLEKPLYGNKYSELRPLLERLNQQNELVRSQFAELEDKKKEFALLTENMNEGLVIINDQGYILSINKRAVQIFGLQDAVNYENKHILMAERHQELQKLVDDGLCGQAQALVLELDGRTYEVVGNPTESYGSVQGLVLLILDVTEKRQQEQLRREFTANVSHELRTPLTAISGYAEIMMHGLVSQENVQPFAEKIYKEANRMIVLIGDIIQLSRLDETSEQFHWETVDLAQLAEDVAQRLQQKAEQQMIQLSVYTEPTTIVGIAHVLQEILYNLCDNAIKYNKPEGSVKLSVIQTGGTAVVKVMDTGIGIAPEDQPRVFERFYRADKSHSRLIGGTGLGLSIVKHGIQLHGGEVQLESTLGTGTTITVRLPIKQPEQ